MARSETNLSSLSKYMALLSGNWMACRSIPSSRNARDMLVEASRTISFGVVGRYGREECDKPTAQSTRVATISKSKHGKFRCNEWHIKGAIIVGIYYIRLPNSRCMVDDDDLFSWRFSCFFVFSSLYLWLEGEINSDRNHRFSLLLKRSGKHGNQCFCWRASSVVDKTNYLEKCFRTSREREYQTH